MIHANRPSWAAIALAFGVVYIGYGLNFLAIKTGVDTMPPFLFAGAHVFLAGAILLGYIVLRGGRPGMELRFVGRAALASLFLFVGGVGLVTAGEKHGVESAMAAIIKASAPLWVAVLESVRPGGERVGKWTAAGLLLGAVGVVWLVYPRLSGDTHPLGIWMLVISALSYAIGALLIRHWPPGDSVLHGTSYQMLLGGAYLLLLGTALGETREVHRGAFTPQVWMAFLFLLFVHSLAAFSALNWLLHHLPASVATTKFYVSPVIAIVAGSLVRGEKVTPEMIGCTAMILAGVGVILAQGATHVGHAPAPVEPNEIEESVVAEELET